MVSRNRCHDCCARAGVFNTGKTDESAERILSGMPRTPEERLAELLAPLGIDEFFSAYYERQPAVLRGTPDRARGPLSQERLIEVIVRERDRRGTLMLSDKLPVDVEPAAGLRSYLEQGH